MQQGEDRNSAIIRLYKQGKTNREIQKLLRAGPNTISDVIKTYKRFNEIPIVPKRGRHDKKTLPLLTFVQAQSLINRRISCEAIKDLWNQENRLYFTVSESTIRRARHELKFNFRSPKIRQALSDSQITKRYSFATNFLRCGATSDKLIFSDESRICLGPDNRYIWFQPGEVSDDVYVEYTKAEIGIMVWGAIGKDFKSKLIICPKSVNSYEYQKIIKDSQIVDILNQQHGEGNWYFMQDGAKPHVSHQTLLFLNKRMSLLDNWPANSPDLNPIEHLWAILKYRMRERKPKTIQELIDVIMEEWESIDMSLINSLVESFEKRLKLVIHEGGKQVGYLINKYDNNIDVELDDNIQEMNIFTPICKDLEEPLIQNTAPFTIEEDQLLLNLYITIGPKWKKMEQHFNGRTNYSLRNRFFKLRPMDKKKRVQSALERNQSQSTESADVSEDDQINATNTPLDSLFEPIIPTVTLFDANRQ